MINTLPSTPAGFDDAVLQKLSLEHTVDQQLWLSGYLYGLAMARRQGGGLAVPDVAPAALPATAPGVAAPAAAEKLVQDKIRILFGSHTGNSKKIAGQAAEVLRTTGWEVAVSDMNDYPVKNLKDEKYLLLVVSTQGEGDPPTAAEEFYRWLHGPRAPKLNGLKFAVCGLGDKSYLNFCQTGKDFDKQLEALGATRFAARADCDTDYEQTCENWIKSVAAAVGVAKPAAAVPVSIAHPNGAAATGTAVAPGVVAAPAGIYGRKNPFEASVFEKIQLNGRGSVKETWHLELALQDSGLTYEPGDALGIFASNSDRLVEQVLKVSKLSGSESVEYEGEYGPLGRVLQEKVELTVLTRDVVETFAKKTQEPKLFNLLKDNNALKDFLWGRNILDLLTGFPMLLSAQQLVNALRKMPPRLYSIASSLAAHPEEVHLTVAAVRYEFNGNRREGVGSTFLADRVEIGDNVPVFIERNEYFKLPVQDDTDIIMVGPGTGVAPFRAFVAERAERGASGRNWLFFGNPHFTTDFLYQAEWLQHLKNGTLDRLDVAFSRDQSQKVYVQQRVLERSKLLFERLENGAYFYICGDKNRMAHDVQAALKTLIAKESGKGAEFAAEYVQNLKKTRRFLEDVY